MLTSSCLVSMVGAGVAGLLVVDTSVMVADMIIQLIKFDTLLRSRREMKLFLSCGRCASPD